MKRAKYLLVSILATACVGSYSYHVFAEPPTQSSLKPPAYDLWGRSISEQEAKELKKTPEGRAMLSPKNGAVEINQQLLALGEQAFFDETFGNEVYLTDILGAFDGPITLPNVQKAIAALKGEATTNLRVELAQDYTILNRTYRKGDMIDTGLDVAKGARSPLGIKVVRSEGRLKAGFTCAACHATVDPVSKRVLPGVTNPDFDAGLILAMATNSASYFTHSGVADLKPFTQGSTRKVQTSDGKTAALPDPVLLEKAADESFITWPRGTFDNTIDLQNDPTQVQDAFTFEDYPYSWSGVAMAGPFKGLSALNNSVHAQNADPLAQTDNSRAFFGLDKEVYIGTILQNSFNPKYRYSPESGVKPSEFFAKVDPNPGTPGVLEAVLPPSYPKVTLALPAVLQVSSPGTRVHEQNNALSAYQNTLVPPKARIKTSASALARGEVVFQRAGCASCHAGPSYTNHKIIPVSVIGTDPARAGSFKRAEGNIGESLLHSPDTPVPVPPGATVLKVPVGHLDPEQIKLAFGFDRNGGGYKVQSLIGVAWSAPYLHEGGVAVGPDEKTQLGISGTLSKGIIPDPANSLKAMVDRELRAKVIAANHASKELRSAHVQGIGHEYWVDEDARFTKEDQDALIQFLMTRNEYPVQKK